MGDRLFTWICTATLCIGAFMFDMMLIDPSQHHTFDWLLYLMVGGINFCALFCFVVVVSREAVLQMFRAVNEVLEKDEVL